MDIVKTFLILLSFGIIGGFAVAALLFSELNRVSDRLFRLERKMDLVIKQMGLESRFQVQASEDIMTLLKYSRKIDAIKLYRDKTGLGLKEAKDAVDEIERSLVPYS
jgi:ribosomal protein L7/L12